MSNKLKEFDENEFDDALFEQFNSDKKEIPEEESEENHEETTDGKKKWNGHIIFFIIRHQNVYGNKRSRQKTFVNNFYCNIDRRFPLGYKVFILHIALNRKYSQKCMN